MIQQTYVQHVDTARMADALGGVQTSGVAFSSYNLITGLYANEGGSPYG